MARPRTRLFVQNRAPVHTLQLDDAYRGLSDDARAGAFVTLFLCEDAVYAARRRGGLPALENALAAGVEILVDRRSLRARGLRAACLVPGARTAGLCALADRIAAGERATWL